MEASRESTEAGGFTNTESVSPAHTTAEAKLRHKGQRNKQAKARQTNSRQNNTDKQTTAPRQTDKRAKANRQN